ncbi:hypothetical protein FRC01_001347 [Tulasnella sp. 417]|nr:hypothetical protein FRC01_001347 [Tulasnella sp. 417]
MVRVLTQVLRKHYKSFTEIYDAISGILPKNRLKKYPASHLNKGDPVAVELAVKKWSASGELAEHGSYNLRGVLLLRKGTAEDEGRVDSATSAPV